MDKKTFLGFALITLIVMAWLYMMNPTTKQTAQPTKAQQDSAAQAAKLQAERAPAQQDSGLHVAAKQTSAAFAGLIDTSATAGEHIIETDLFTMSIAERGGVIKHFILKKYKTWFGGTLDLIPPESPGNLSLLFSGRDGRLVDTKVLHHTIAIRKTRDTTFVDCIVAPEPTKRIIKTIAVTNGSYTLATSVRFENMQEALVGYQYQLTWESSPPFAEFNSVSEAGFAKARAYMSGERVEIDATKPTETYKSSPTGKTDWVASRNKYFLTAIISTDGKSEGAYLEGANKLAAQGGQTKSYAIALKMPFKAEALQTNTFILFLGPLDYNIVKHVGYDLQKNVDFGWKWIVGPIGEYFMLPIFKFLHQFIANYGIVIIVFSILFKLLLYPLSVTQIKSARKMQALQPEIAKIKEKHADSMPKQSEETMKLYREYGVNPAGGCLPMLLQLPILYALWAVLSSAIELRQTSFVWWINDLSVPDELIKLNFSLPLLGAHVSGIMIALIVTMVIQQRQTVTSPQQKQMAYIMPVVMAIMFNNLPSGVTLYYLVFNVLGITQQWIQTRGAKDMVLVKVKPSDKKKSGFMARLESTAKEAQEQRRKQMAGKK